MKTTTENKSANDEARRKSPKIKTEAQTKTPENQTAIAPPAPANAIPSPKEIGP